MKNTLKEYFEVAKNELFLNKFFLVGVVIFLAFFELFLPNRTNCLVKNLTGMPCPTCGMTRAFKSVIRFDFESAFEWHPLFWMIPFLAIVVILRKHPHYKKFNSTVFWVVVSLIFISVYVVRMIFLFPDEAPLDFEPNGLIPFIFRTIKDIVT